MSGVVLLAVFCLYFRGAIVVYAFQEGVVELEIQASALFELLIYRMACTESDIEVNTLDGEVLHDWGRRVTL